jgi:hypothetical protein
MLLRGKSSKSASEAEEVAAELAAVAGAALEAVYHT